jgi:hypothetical protein
MLYCFIMFRVFAEEEKGELSNSIALHRIHRSHVILSRLDLVNEKLTRELETVSCGALDWVWWYFFAVGADYSD